MPDDGQNLGAPFPTNADSTFSLNTGEPLDVTLTSQESPPLYVDVSILRITLPAEHNVLLTGQFTADGNWRAQLGVSRASGGSVVWGLRVLLDGTQVDGTYFQTGMRWPITLSTSRVLPVPAGAHTFTVQVSVQVPNPYGFVGERVGIPISTIAARAFAVVDLGPYHAAPPPTSTQPE